MEPQYVLKKGVWCFTSEPHFEKKLEYSRCKELLSQGGYAVRNVYDFDTKDKTEFWYLIKDGFGGFEELTSKMRNKVRRGFNDCDIKMIAKEELLHKGYDVYCAAMEHYRVKAVASPKKEFEEIINSCDKEEWDFWGVYLKGSETLIAFAMNSVTEDMCGYRIMKAIPQYQQQHRPYYGLIYEMNRYYLEEKKKKYVSDGARSITNHSNVQSFLTEDFHFRRAYCHLQVIYPFWMKLIIKILYPFRKIIPFRKVTALLNMEWMARNSAEK